MPFPHLTEIKIALQNPALTFIHKKLKAAQLEDPDFAICDKGRYAVVSKIKLGGKTWALRIPIGVWPDSANRYRMINDIAGSSTNALVDCQFLPQAMRVPVPNGPLYDVVVMEWIDGQNLSTFVTSACKRRDTEAISEVKESLLGICNELQDLQISHGDLSPLNILVAQSEGKHLAKLVDYDFLSHPSLSISTTLPGSPTRHPLRPKISDTNSDLFVFQLYDTVLDAMRIDPTLIDRLNDYDDQTLFISFSDPTGASLANLEAMRLVVPDRISALEKLAIAPYLQTPKPIRPIAIDVEVILASDWRSLRRSSGSRVAVSGVVDSASSTSIVLAKASRLNRSTSVVVQPRRSSAALPARGDRIIVTGVVHLEGKTIAISAAEFQVVDAPDSRHASTTKAVRDHIASAKSRIRQRFDKRPPLKIKAVDNGTRLTTSGSKKQSQASTRNRRPTSGRPYVR